MTSDPSLLLTISLVGVLMLNDPKSTPWTNLSLVGNHRHKYIFFSKINLIIGRRSWLVLV